MKLSELKYQVEIRKDDVEYWWLTDKKKVKGIIVSMWSDKDFKTRKGCIKNMEKFMKLNGFKYRMVG